uniref:NADH-ubiquinone oxidoreductase chain 6 n=1 Tax=Caloptilia theivora TaxID=914280 RepID=A0A6G6CEI7_9NEOP|nr:NADH dehydrogenase subunit 6 [Caloptilia theivora]QID90524.1 NADH dehydrogenase subunit 6 [Caloptilia theivora]
MMKIFLSWLMLTIPILMYFMNHPLSMGLMILLQTILICLMSGMMINTYWFFYLLFLTFLGGLLVLFIYVSSIASNEMFLKFYNFLIITLSSMLLILITNYFFFNNLNWMNLVINNEMMELNNNFMFFNNDSKINLTKLYNNKTFFFMMMMIIYLFITLVAVVKITNIFYGPLRSSNF